MLGAGASYCYEDGQGQMPLQRDIASHLFMGIYTSSPEMQTPGYFVAPEGIRHTSTLADFMRNRFSIEPGPYQQESPQGRSELDFWNVLQERGYTLESLYGELEAENQHGQHQAVLEDFAAIVRTIVRAPAKNRELETVCRYHRALAEALEPGDYIVNFNWDSLMADALLFYSPLWFPVSGLGVPVSKLRMFGPRPKTLNIVSAVQLFHVHGAVFLYESEPAPNVRKEVMYAGPRSDSWGSSFAAAAGIDHAGEVRDASSFNLSDEDERRLYLGSILHGDDRRWFRPIFVPPTRDKGLDMRGYPILIRKRIHALLPGTKRLLIAGYSFPEADGDHLRRLFPEAVMDPMLEVVVVNPSINDEAFRSRLEAIFPARIRKTYASTDFKTFCRELESGTG